MEQVVENLKVAEEGIQNSLSKDELMIFDIMRKQQCARTKADCMTVVNWYAMHIRGQYS